MTIDTMEFVDVDASALLPDIPAGLTDDEICEVSGCSEPIVYGGRGRKPKRCPEHKGTRGATVRPETVKTKRGKANDIPARRAAQSLSQMNALIGTTLLLLPKPYGMPATGSALANANEGFEEAAYEALLTDPKLCQMINKAGAVSGKFSLLFAYAMLGAAVAPVAIDEFQSSRT